MEYANIIVAVVAFIVSLVSLITSLLIKRKDDNRNFNDYLLDKIVFAYNCIEADIVLLDQGLVDEDFTRFKVNKEVILSLSSAKAKARSLREDALFDYLDSVLCGTDETQTGQFIDNYFDKRDKYLEIKDENERLEYSHKVLVPILDEVREYRNRIIDDVFKKVKLVNKHRR